MNLRIPALVLLAALWLCIPARCDENAQYDVVSVTSEQLSNGVQVKISANGTMSIDMSKWYDGNYYTDWGKHEDESDDWRDCVFPTKIIGVTLHKARSLVGDYVYIGKYPVSHVRLTVPDPREVRGGDPIGKAIDIEVILYSGAKIGMVRGDDWCDYYDRWFTENSPLWVARCSDDKRSILVTVTSDRQPDPPMHRKLDDVPEAQRDLKVTKRGESLDVHARNTPLSEVMRVVSETTGRRVLVDASAERLVTAELPRTSIGGLLKGICRCYGLESVDTPDGLVLRGALASSAASFAGSETRRIQLRYTTAEKARGLLPNFLMEHVRPSDDGGALIVSGAADLADKIASDVQVLDKPDKMVRIKATLLEVSATVDLARELSAEVDGRGFGLSADASQIGMRLDRLTTSAPDLRARLNALASIDSVRVCNTVHLTVLSGQKGKLFAGSSRYINVNDGWWDTLQQVKAGMLLKVSAWAANDTIRIDLGSEVTSIVETDKVTRLPVVDTNQAYSTLYMKPGESILVGGLDLSQPATTMRKSPIPVMGRTDRQSQDRHLVLLLTPTVMEEPNANKH